MRTTIGMVMAVSCIARTAEADVSSLPACDGPAMRIIHYEVAAIGDLQLSAGDVIIEFAVDASGRVSEPRILNSSNEQLDAYALKSAVLWRYAPPKSACRHRMQVLF